MTAQIFAPIQIQDALKKFNLYVSTIINKNLSHDKNQKICHLAMELFIKFSESDHFVRQSYESVKNYVLTRHNYYLLYLIDQMLKNNKYVIKTAKKQLQSMFKNVWTKIWAEYDNQEKLENLRVISRVWGYIYGQKYEDVIRKWIEITYNKKATILRPQNEIEIKKVYGTIEQFKPDIKYEELMHNMEVQQRSKKISSRDQSLLEALGIDQD